MKVIRVLMFALAFLTVPIVDGAPDTPPTMSWELALPEPSPDLCDGVAGNTGRIVQIATGHDNAIYTQELCDGSVKDRVIVRRIASNGVILWTHIFENGLSVTPMSIAADPDNRVWVWNNDATQATQTRILSVWDSNEDLAFVKSNAQFTNSNTVTTMSFKEVDADSFIAYAGGPSARMLFTCDVPTTCEIVTDSAATLGYKPHYAGPYNDTLYGSDFDDGSGQAIVARFSTTTAGHVDSQNLGVLTACCADITSPWYNPSNDLISYPIGKITGGAYENFYYEVDRETSTTVRGISPIESRVFGYTLSVPFQAFVDGAGSVFYCGSSESGTAIDGYVAKYNSTVNMGMRWNISLSKQASTNQESVTSCAMSRDGSIYAGLYSCANIDTQCSSYVRKYASAASARSLQGIFEGYTNGGATPTGGAGNIVRTASDFCSDAWGFDCDWLFAMAIVGIAVVASRHAHVLVIATVLFLALGVSTLMGVLPEWVMFVFVFLVIVFAGVKLFGGNGDSNGGD